MRVPTVSTLGVWGGLFVVMLGACAPSRPRAGRVEAGARRASRAAAPSPPAPESLGTLRWLEEHSMLHEAGLIARRYSANGETWRRPYANADPRAAAALASVWFTAYPASTVARPGESVLAALGDAGLWRSFREIGITGMHTGPMKRAGGLRGRAYTPTIDGNFDRISTEIDPAFGSEDEYKALTRNARTNGAIVIGDVIPGHSGKGADFRLAERAYRDYPGLYHMVEIAAPDWTLLPAVEAGRDSVNLDRRTVDELARRGYVVGQLPRTIFYEPGIKDTDWSATDIVLGADGRKRRWVYLHYFKEGQPTFNWLDPTFAAPRLVAGDALHSLGVLGESMLRLDANGFLGIEIGKQGAPAWSEGHPLSLTVNQLLAGLVRKVGGFTFQELNLTLDDIKAMSQGGADLSYDFVTRPAYQHALVTGDAEFLRLMLRLERQYGIDPAGLIHALQNHDELTLELVHFWTRHKDDAFRFRGRELKGAALRELVREEMHTRLLAVPYNLKASNGISCTTASLIAATLGLRSAEPSAAELEEIQRAHLLLVMFNAMQPGIVALSGWDLVGAMTLPSESVRSLMADGDTRWIERGAYDLRGDGAGAKGASRAKLPLARALYGPLDDQLGRRGSFVARLKEILRVRAEFHVYDSEQLESPTVRAKGLVVLVHRLPGDRGTEVTALNFGRAPIREAVNLGALVPARARAEVKDLLARDGAKPAFSNGELTLELGAHEGRALLIR